jgi:hypothetical protein
MLLEVVKFLRESSALLYLGLVGCWVLLFLFSLLFLVILSLDGLVLLAFVVLLVPVLICCCFLRGGD